MEVMSVAATIDCGEAAVLLANMLQCSLQEGSASTVGQEAFHDVESGVTTSRKAGLHLRTAINFGSGAPPSGEHRASVRPSEQGVRSGVAAVDDSDIGRRPGAVRSSQPRPRGFQNSGTGRVDWAGPSGPPP